MYSYEDRLRAVMLYLKLGRRINATLRQLGYSNKNSLKAWCAAFEQNRDLRRGYQRVITGSSTPHNMPRPRATKQQAIIALNTRFGSAKEVADAPV